MTSHICPACDIPLEPHPNVPNTVRCHNCHWNFPLIEVPWKRTAT